MIINCIDSFPEKKNDNIRNIRCIQHSLYLFENNFQCIKESIPFIVGRQQYPFNVEKSAWRKVIF